MVLLLLYSSNFKYSRYFIPNPLYLYKILAKKTPTTHHTNPAAQHNMISQCYCLRSSAWREGRHICNIWVYQQVGICTDDVVM